MLLKHDLPVEYRIAQLVGTMQQAGFETYIVGGAIRDLLLGRQPKDYDISTAAKPEELVNLFGRRRARIIGKRFRLVHVRMGEDLVEVSTFRRAPEKEHQVLNKPRREPLPDTIIVNDNDFGTCEEDALRRDFTINSLYYDPTKNEIIDHTGKGMTDIEQGIVRAIGDPMVRFAEDPVRLLRALKLVGQYDFTMDDRTENALFACLPLIQHASGSRMSLELEKVFSSAYGDKHLEVFHDYGFLGYFLPFFESAWNTPEMELALDLLSERNVRMLDGCFRNSISLAMAALLLPFAERDAAKQADLPLQTVVRDLAERVFKPQCMIKRLVYSCERIVEMQFAMARTKKPDKIIHSQSYDHARELMMIQNEVRLHDRDLAAKWPPCFGNSNHKNQPRARHDRKRNTSGRETKNTPKPESMTEIPPAVPTAVEQPNLF